MNRQAGVWIDHREAFIVFAGEGEKATQVASGVEASVRFSGGNRPSDGQADDQRDGKMKEHLNRFYDEVISRIGEARSLLIFGPGEAKGELESRLAHKGLGSRVVGVEAMDRMTVPQIEAKVRRHFGP